MNAPNVAGPPSVSASVAGTVPPRGAVDVGALADLTAALAAAIASGVLAWPGVAPPSGTSPSARPRSSTSDCALQPPLVGDVRRVEVVAGDADDRAAAADIRGLVGLGDRLRLTGPQRHVVVGVVGRADLVVTRGGRRARALADVDASEERDRARLVGEPDVGRRVLAVRQPGLGVRGGAGGERRLGQQAVDRVLRRRLQVAQVAVGGQVRVRVAGVGRHVVDRRQPVHVAVDHLRPALELQLQEVRLLGHAVDVRQRRVRDLEELVHHALARQADVPGVLGVDDLAGHVVGARARPSARPASSR